MGPNSSWHSASIYEFEGDKIRRKVDYWDFAMAMRQLGALPAK